MGRTAKRLLAVLVVLGVFGALLALSVLGTAPETPLPGIALGPRDGALLLLAEGEDGPYIACSQESASTLTALNTATEDAAQVTLSYPLLGAAWRGTHLVAFSEYYGFLRLDIFTSGLEHLSENYAPDLLDELALYDATADGCLYAVLQEDSATLYFYDMQGGEWERTFDSPIRLLQITGQGQLWVCTADSCYAGDAQNPDSLRLIPGGQPQRILGSNIFMDSSGQVWRITGASSEPALPSLPIYGLCSAGSMGVVYADDTGRIHQILWDGTEQGSCFTAGEPLALTDEGVLYQQDGLLYYALLDFTPPQAEPSLSPEPTEPPAPTPSLEPGPSLEPEPSLEPYPSWLDFREGYIYITGRVPVMDLVVFLGPQEVFMETPSGASVVGGVLATGMQARWSRDNVEFTEARIIVWGDCDGNGKITEADMEQAQLMLLQGRGTAEEYYFLAADRDEDGEITAQDLLWLSAELEGAD